MGLDANKLYAMQILAEQKANGFDTAKCDGKINTKEEVNVFKTDLEVQGKALGMGDNEIQTVFNQVVSENYEKGNLSAQDYTEIMGGQFATKPSAEVGNVKEEKVEKTEPEKVKKEDKTKEQKNEEERVRKLFVRQLEEALHKLEFKKPEDRFLDLENLPEMVIDEYITQSSINYSTLKTNLENNPYVQELKAALSDVIIEMRTFMMKDKEESVSTGCPYRNTEAVDKNFDAITKKFKDSKMHKEIAKKMKEYAKQSVYEHRYREFATAYESHEGTEAPLAKLETVKNKLKFEDKFDKDMKKAYKSYENTVKEGLKKEYNKCIAEAAEENPTVTKTGKILDLADAKMKAKGLWEVDENGFELTEAIVHGGKSIKDHIYGNKNQSEMYAEVQAVENNLQLCQKQTKAEILESLGQKSELFEALESSGVITYDEKTGEYDLTELQSALAGTIGADNIQNRHAAIDKATSECKMTQVAAAMATNLESLTEKEGERLAKLCGYKVEGKNWRKAILDAITFGAVNTIAGAASLLTYQEKFRVNNDISFEMSMENAEMDTDAIADSLENQFSGLNGATVTVTALDGVSVLVNIKQTIDILEKLPDNLDLLGRVALTNGLIGAAQGFLQGLQDKGETSVTMNYTKEDTLDGLEKELMAYYWNQPEKLGLFLSIAKCQALDNDGKFDRQKYNDMLQDIGGRSGKINVQELMSGLEKFKCDPEEAAKKSKKGDEKKDEPTAEPIKDQITIEKQTIQGETHTVPFDWKRNHSWMSVIATFYPEALKNHTPAELTRALKNMLGVGLDKTTPYGTTVQMDELKVGDKVYKPGNGDNIENNSTNETWGWGSRYYNNASWQYKTNGKGKSKTTVRKDEDSIKYNGTRQSDNKTMADKDEKNVYNGLKPEAREDKDIKVTVSTTNYETTLDKEYTVKKKEKDQK